MLCSVLYLYEDISRLRAWLSVPGKCIFLFLFVVVVVVVACVRACVHACMRACVRACVCACVCVFSAASAARHQAMHIAMTKVFDKWNYFPVSAAMLLVCAIPGVQHNLFT